MTDQANSQTAEMTTIIGDRVSVLPDGTLTVVSGERERVLEPSADQFWKKVAELAVEKVAPAKILRGFVNGKVVRDPIYPNGYIVEGKCALGMSCREGRLDMTTGETCLPKDQNGKAIVRQVYRQNARLRGELERSDGEMRRSYGTFFYINEDLSESVVYSGVVPELLTEEMIKEFNKGSQVFIIPVRKTDEVMIAVNRNQVRFHAFFREEVNFTTEKPDFWLNFAKAATDPSSEQAFQAQLITKRFWKMDPKVPDRVLQPDADLNFWCRAGFPYEKSFSEHDTFSIRTDADFGGEYGGRKLYHPTVSGLYISELCAEPGTYYGPWHIMKEDDEAGSYFVGCSAGDDFEDALKAVDELLSLPEFPKPLPEWNKLPGADADKNEGFVGDVATLDLDLFEGCKGKVTAHFSTRDDIWTETYRVDVLDSKGVSFGIVGFGENLGSVMELRDNKKFFEGVVGSLKRERAEKIKRLESDIWELMNQGKDAETDPDILRKQQKLDELQG